MNNLSKKNNFKKAFWFLFYVFIFCLLLRNSFNYLDPDWGWHLEVGHEIAQTQMVPVVNHYNYTFTGNWVDHEWLSNFLIYQLNTHFGYIAVSIFFSLLLVLVLVLLNKETQKLKKKPFALIVILQIIAVIAALPHLGVRIQELGLLFLFLLLAIFNYYQEHKSWSILILLPLLMYVWANMHASFLLGIFLIFSYLGIKIAEKVMNKFWPWSFIDFSKILSWRELFVFMGSTVLAVAATLVTPYRFALYSFLGRTMIANTFYQTHIREWLSQFSFPFVYWQLFYLAIVVFALLLYIYYSRGREKYFKINIWKLFLVSLFIFLSFRSRRHFPLMVVATFVFVLEVYSRVFRSEHLEIKAKRADIFSQTYLLFSLLLVSVLGFTQIKFTNKPFESYCKDYPCQAVEYLKQHPELNRLRLFNSYNWGGYLIERLPQRSLFIDGRLPQAELKSKVLLQEYYEFFKKNINLEDKFKEYNIKLVLLPSRDHHIKAKNWEKFLFNIKNNNLSKTNYLRQYLLSSRNWKIVYQDKTATLFSRQ